MSRKNGQFRLRPSLSSSALEDRVVLATGKAAAIVAAAASPTPAPSPFTPIGNTRLTAPQLEQDFLAVNARDGCSQTEIQTDAAALYANGHPSSFQLFNFNSEVAGAIDATALRLSSQAALLPGTNIRLLAQIQNNLMGPSGTSLVNRIAGTTISTRLTSSPAMFQASLANNLSQIQVANAQSLASYFNTTSINRDAVDANGQMIPLQQFIGTQIVNQFENNLGALSSAFSTQLGQLFNNTAAQVSKANVGNTVRAAQLTNATTTTPTAAQISAFQNSTAQALGLVTNTLGNDLSLLGSTASQFNSQIQNAFNVAAPGSTSSFFGGLMNSITSFRPGVGPNLTNPFLSPLNTLGPQLKGEFGLPASTQTTLPTSQFTSVFNPSFTGTTFNSGFNNGFGSGFTGFGTTPTNFKSNFNTGFSNVLGSANKTLGFTQPSIIGTTTTTGVGTGSTTVGIGTGTTTGTGSGTGTTTTFI